MMFSGVGCTIIDWFGFEETSKVIQFHPPAMGISQHLIHTVTILLLHCYYNFYFFSNEGIKCTFPRMKPEDVLCSGWKEIKFS